MDALTPEQFKECLPDKMKKSVSAELIAQVNKTLSEPELFEQYRENLVSYASVLRDGKFKLSSYIDAVKYVSHKLMGCTNIDAYSKTFPEKIKRFTLQNVSKKDISSYVTAYNKSKLVTLIYAQSITPSWILNQDLYQEALNVQAQLMTSANSEKVRCDAANSILTHLKMPETQKVELDIGVKQDSTIDQLRQATLALVEQQRQMLLSGSMNAGQIAKTSVIVEGEVVRD